MLHLAPGFKGGVHTLTDNNFTPTLHQLVIINGLRPKNIDKAYLFGHWTSSRIVDINKVYQLGPRHLSKKIRLL